MHRGIEASRHQGIKASMSIFRIEEAAVFEYKIPPQTYVSPCLYLDMAAMVKPFADLTCG